ncbi:MAG: transposase [Sedimentisphaerales bacterium]|nr:transposase [Sedimentisphaerales bacterium]
MARPLRIDQEDTFYHVLNRGNERRAVFRDARDCEGFLVRLGRCAQRFSLGVYAYVLMGNHYHLLVRTRQANLSAAMQWLGVSYSTWHNARHERSGHLFQGRFKSFFVAEDAYLYRLLLYLHRNPLRARLVKRLADYPWSSYRALAYARGGPAWFDRRLVYGQFDLDGRRFREAVARYDEERDDLLSELHYGLVLGSAEIVEDLRRRLRGERDPEKPQWRALHAHGTVAERLAAYADRLGIAGPDLEELLRPVRHRERPDRDVLMYLLWRDGRLRLGQIAPHFGVGYGAVSRACRRTERRVQTDRKFRRALEAITE